jgi:hypothetical protein
MVDVVSFQGEPQTSLGEIGQVNGQMAPNGAMVVPQMVVGVARVATDGQFCFWIHRCVLFAGSARTRRGMKTKKPSDKFTTASGFQGEYFDSGTPKGSRASASDIAPAKAPLPSHQGQEAGNGPKPKPLLMLTLKELSPYYPEVLENQDSFVS